MADAAVLQPGAVRRQRVGQTDLVDHPDSRPTFMPTMPR